MPEFQPITLFVNQGEIDLALRQWDERKDYFQSIVNKYKLLNIAAPLLENDLVEMMNAPKEFLVKKITEGNKLNIGGMKLEADKAFDLIEKPTGCIEFINTIENAKKHDSAIKYYYRHAYFFVIVDGLVEIKPEELEKITTQNTVFLRSQKEKDIYDLLSSLCESINALNKVQKINHIQDTLFRDLINVNPSTGHTSINESFLKIYNR